MDIPVLLPQCHKSCQNFQGSAATAGRKFERSGVAIRIASISPLKGGGHVRLIEQQHRRNAFSIMSGPARTVCNGFSVKRNKDINRSGGTHRRSIRLRQSPFPLHCASVRGPLAAWPTRSWQPQPRNGHGRREGDDGSYH